jgi:phthiocerol/phenolphthiocerol synthesis type-I polyketide synthase E
MKPDDQHVEAIDYHGAEIAIIGMAARFPGADSVDEFWQNLLLQREGIRHFSAEELAEAGVSAAQLDDPAYVRAKGVLRDTMAFDAAFFSYSDREAALMDPQLRLYHECAWHALEDSGYAGRQSETLTGIFGGASANALWTSQYARIAEQGGAAAYEVINLINRDFFNSRLAYKLNLKGPAVTVQTACSTSLVAVHQACQSLLAGDTDLALAGAVSLSLNPALAAPELQGYMYQEGMILSPDGHCRPFDADAQGTVLSDGVGFVVLKRLQDAIADGDRIHAVIKGSAINNDGNDKIGYTAPSASGQREALTAALTLAGVAPESVGYIEAHGTGTSLGDPIEVQALMQAYDGFPAPCLIGSVKGNLGHLDTAAGMAGLIKAVLAVRHGQVPASLHFQQLNPKCDLQGTGLEVAASNQHWPQQGLRRAGISSFGIGGTNAHVIIEEYRAVQTTAETRSAWLLPLSAKTSASLNAYREQLQAWLPSAKSLGDVAFSLAHKRADFDWRQAILVDSRGAFLSASQTTAIPETAPNLYWMFTGQGAQYPQMGRDLYASEPVFRAALDRCLAMTDSLGVTQLRNLLLGEDASPAAQDQLRATELAQPALFAVEYSLAQLLTSWGLKPAGFIGHSLGEYVAACLAGVFSLDDALRLVVARGRLMASTAPGAMLAVLQGADSLDLGQWPQVSLAAINGAQSCVLAGPPDAIAQAKAALEAGGTATRPLNTSHAFHSPLMEPILREFGAVLAQIPLRAPSLPIVSNLTGNWVEPTVMATPDYWVNQLRQPVHFHQGLACLLADPNALLLEVGPGKTLSSLARQHPARQPQQVVVHSLRAITDTESDSLQPRRALGELWSAGAQLDWDACNAGGGNLCSLPGYAFERNSHMPLVNRSNLVDAPPVGGFYREQWVSIEASELLAASSSDVAGPILVLHSGQPDERALIEALTARGQSIIEITPGDSFARQGQGYQLRPQQAEDYHQLGQELLRIGQAPAKVIQLWQPEDSNHYQAFAGLLLLTQALAQLGFTQAMGIYAITKGAFRVTGDETLNSAAALVYGPIRSLGQEFPQLHCHLLDVTQVAAQIEPIASAISIAELPLVTAWRGQKVWERQFTCEGENWSKQVREGFKQGGVYVITGGFGGLGAELARHLAREYQAKLLLASRRDQRQHPLLAELRNLGGEAVAMQADMREAGALEKLLSHANNHFGQVTGLLHTAGLPGDTLVLRHQLEKAVDVIATKLNPALDSLRLAPAYGLEQVVFFSSVTGVLGGLGQTDYCAANAALDAVAEQARSLGLSQFYSIRWDAWRETGMAVDSLNARLPVVAASGHSLLGDQLAAADGSYIYSQTLTPEHCWALSEHWVMGQPTLPGTSYLEMAGAAFTRLTGQTAKTFSDIYFLSPLVLAAGESADVYTRLVTETHGYSFEVGSFHRQHKQWQLHARGQLQTAFASTAIADLAGLKARNNQRYMDDIRGAADLGVRAMGLSLSQAEQDALMKYGPRWTVVRELWLGQNQGLARLELADELRSDLSAMDLHPALLDCALSWLRAFLDGGVYIPLSYQRMVQYQPLPAEFYSQVTLSSALDKALGAVSFDLQLLSPAGELLAEVTGFTMRRIDADFAAGAATRALPAPAYVHQYRELPKGLDTAAALAALEKIIVAAPPVALVAASDFIAREAGADQGDMGLFGAAAFTPPPQRARPAISVEYLAPKNPQQRQLADVWQALLGLEQVGIQDDFFELGGDSLLLMQVHKQLQGLFGSDLAVVELYNHPTIEKLSAWLDSRKGADGEAAADATLDEVSDRIEKQKAARKRRARQDS